MMMGMVEDPEDHKAVASAVFISVAVYAVRCSPKGRIDNADDVRVSLCSAVSRLGCT